jgi:hypothetical protein
MHVSALVPLQVRLCDLVSSVNFSLLPILIERLRQNTVYLGSIHQVLSFGPFAGCRSCRVVNRVRQRVQVWVHYGSNKRCVGLFFAL